MTEHIFINFIPDDLPFVEQIKKRLELAGLEYTTPPAKLDPLTQNEMVEKIKSIAASHGCMLSIISNKAVSNSIFISNIQLMCETARTGRVLVNYHLEPLENDQSIRLFASQVYQIMFSKHPAADVSRIIQRIHQVLQPPTRNIFQSLSRHISRRAILRLSITALVLGVGGALLFNLLQPAPAAPLLPTPTPVVMYVPFSGQSQDAGLKVSARAVPVYKPDTDPAGEAPFAFKPAAVLESDDFNDPAYDQIFDDQKWMNNFNRLESAPGTSISQANGVLQLAVAPTGGQTGYLILNSKYSFNPQQVTYLGYRFRLDDYQGVVQENTYINESSTYQFVDIPDTFRIQFDGLSQKLYFNSSEIDLGSRWHALEIVSQANRQLVDIYLDGKKVHTQAFTGEQFARWMHCTFSMGISNTSDWVSMQIDEVVFGADQPILQTLLPEDAPYRFTPDSVALHEDFETQAYLQALGKGGGFLARSGSLLSFRFPPGKNEQDVSLQFSTRPINENNYYAIRFRFTSPDNDYWANWESLILGVENQDQYNKMQYMDGYNLVIGTSRHDYAFGGSFGINNALGGFPFRQNTQPGNWHTLEMLFKPPADGSLAYTAFYWVDGHLLGTRVSQQDPARLLDPNATLLATIHINGGGYRQDTFSGDIDELVIGTIASDKIKE
jgi:hypothetical protein